MPISISVKNFCKIIEDNTPVLLDESHEGIQNGVHYRVDNGGSAFVNQQRHIHIGKQRTVEN